MDFDAMRCHGQGLALASLPFYGVHLDHMRTQQHYQAAQDGE